MKVYQFRYLQSLNLVNNYLLTCVEYLYTAYIDGRTSILGHMCTLHAQKS